MGEGCSSCQHKSMTSATINNMLRSKAKQADRINMNLIVEKSKNPDVKVGLVYYGGGMIHKPWEAHCSSCSGGLGRVSLLTSETIMFASDDAPNGMFKMLFQSGRTYYVTEKQAEYLLTLTFLNQNGERANKFKKLER